MSDTVTIACSLRNGLVLGADEFGRQIALRPAPTGAASPGTVPVISFTEVDADFWAAWLAANANNALVTNNVIWQV